MANANVAVRPTWGPKERRRRRQVWLWAVLLGLMLTALYGLGNRAYGLFDVDEAIFTQATLEMRAAESQYGLQALAMPTYNGEPRYHKPPLIYWAQSIAIEALGDEFWVGGWGLLAARLPSILGVLGAVLLLGLGVSYLTGNRRWGLAAAAAMGLNLSVLVVGRAATADGLLNLWSLALVLWLLVLLFPATLPKVQAAATPAAVKAHIQHAARMLALRRWGWVVTGLLGALAFLAKGPIGWVPAGIVALTLLLTRRDKAAVWRTLAPFRVLMALGLCLAPWLWLLYTQHGGGFFYEFIVVHNLQRFGGDLGNSQSSMAGFYLVVLLLGFFPWVAVLPQAIYTLLRGPGHAKGGSPLLSRPALMAALGNPDARIALPWLALVWAIVYIGVFSFSGTKLAHYIVPCFPALAILVGWWLTLPERRSTPVSIALLWGVWGVVLGALLMAVRPLLEGLRANPLVGWLADAQLAFGFGWPPADAQALAVLQQPIALNDGFLLAGGATLLATVLLLGVLRRRRWLVALVATWAVALGALALQGVPLVGAYTQSPLTGVAASLRDLPPGTVVVHHGLHKPSVRLLSGMPFIKTDNPVQIPPLLNALPGGAAEAWVVVEVQDIPPLLQELETTRAGSVLQAKCYAGTCLLLLAPVKPAPAPV